MTTAPRVHRFEVSPRAGQADPLGDRVRIEAAAIGMHLKSVRTAHVYLVQAPLDEAGVAALQAQLLADPVTESARPGAGPIGPGSAVVEIHPLPGVMDPVAQSVELAVRDLLGVDSRVSTGWRYDLEGVSDQQAEVLAKRLLANPVIQRVHLAPWTPVAFPAAAAHDHALAHVAIRGLSDEQLTKLSREAHLFLSLDEMRTIQTEYRRRDREPTDIELETLAQTWSEHCVHKTLKSTVRYTQPAGPGQWTPIDWTGRPGVSVEPDGTVTIKNLLKSTVAAATHELIADGLDWALSVFVDNSGVIAFDDQHGICIKVETHNRPSAIEPYGGAATGVGGCIRDIIATGLGARPIANTDVFCVAFPDHYVGDAGAGTVALPPGTLHPRRILTQVVAGVRDYGNRMGIPTVHGGVAFDDRYVGNPLVFCGCIGLIPRDKIHGAAQPGDHIIAIGGRTGRDGVHGATFSSAQLEHTAADEFAHAVQIGNAVTEKQLLDAVIRARDEFERPLYNGMTDCGAGGFSSAIGEMGSKLGAEVHLDRAPLKYPGLSYTEIWISEAQERIVLAVPPTNVDAVRRICAEESVDCADLGHFGTPDADLVLLHSGREVGRLSMAFIHDGIPMPTRDAHWSPSAPATPAPVAAKRADAALLALLAHPNIASKHWIIRQYDHEVRGATVIKPLVGPLGRGPSDAAVLEPVPGSGRGIAITCGLQTGLGDPALGGDPYQMALAAIDECVRNAVCTGADPTRLAILDNFCWPSCAKPANMASLVRACLGCYDAAKAYRTPFVSGKDSLNNQLALPDGTVIEIPPTLLITGVGIVPDLARAVTMDAKEPDNLLVIVGSTGTAMGGSHLGAPAGSAMPRVDLAVGPRTARAVAGAIRRGVVRSAHDCSDGGLGVAAAEMLIAGSSAARPIGLELNLGLLPWLGQVAGDATAALFAETPSRYLLEVRPDDLPSLQDALAGVPHAVIGRFLGKPVLRVALAHTELPVDDLARVWLGTLDW